MNGCCTFMFCYFKAKLLEFFKRKEIKNDIIENNKKNKILNNNINNNKEDKNNNNIEIINLKNKKNLNNENELLFQSTFLKLIKKFDNIEKNNEFFKSCCLTCTNKFDENNKKIMREFFILYGNSIINNKVTYS
jgi:predicted nuclease with TOPRIM domain